MKKLLGILLFYLSIHHLQAQQLPPFTQYSDNRGLINPASIHPEYFLKDYNVNVGVMHRSQWVDIPNHPTTSAFRAEMLTETNGGFNFLSGLYILKDRTGPISQTGLYGRINLIKTSLFTNKTGIAAGFLGGVVQYRVRGAEELADDPGDPLLLTADRYQFSPDIGLGISAFHELDNYDNIYIGLSIPQIFNFNLNYKDENGQFSINRLRHFYGSLSYFKFLGEVSHLEMSSWVKYVPNVPINYDVNLRYRMSELLYLGAGWSNAGIGHFEFGLYMGESIGLYNQQLKIGYAYDPAFNRFGFSFGDTHEISISFSFEK